jgi:hypothetical protein
MVGPISRIVLRYVAGALVTLGFLAADLGHMLVDDPDVVAVVQWVLAGAATFAAEGGYWLAKKWEWET